MSRTALVVDDSNSIRQMVGFILRGAGFEVIEGCDGKDGLDRLSTTPGERVDIVITDLNMPNMDGLQLIKALRAKATMRFTPILMLTTESAQERKLEGKAAGATGWIVKPVDPDQFLQVIAKVLPA